MIVPSADSIQPRACKRSGLALSGQRIARRWLSLVLPFGRFNVNHLRAMRWPDSAKPERLQARGWIETADGTMLAVASPRCPLR